jgi:hypothetical protein
VKQEAVACRNDDVYATIRSREDDERPTEYHNRYSFPAYAQGVRTLEVHGEGVHKIECTVQLESTSARDTESRFVLYAASSVLFYGYALTCEGKINRDELTSLVEAHYKRAPEAEDEEREQEELDKMAKSFFTKIYVWLKKNFVPNADDNGYMDVATLLPFLADYNGFFDHLILDVTKFAEHVRAAEKRRDADEALLRQSRLGDDVIQFHHDPTEYPEPLEAAAGEAEAGGGAGAAPSAAAAHS